MWIVVVYMLDEMVDGTTQNNPYYFHRISVHDEFVWSPDWDTAAEIVQSNAEYVARRTPGAFMIPAAGYELVTPSWYADS